MLPLQCVLKVYNMQYWVTSDCHFGHRNIMRYSNRPFASVEEMDETLIYNWNKRVKPEDNIYSLGDFAFGKIGYIKGILSRLNGNIHLIDGNHDREIMKHSRDLLSEGYVKEITSYKELRIHNRHFIFFHYGCRVWNKSHYGSILCFGHSHSNLPPYGKSVDVGVDSTWITGKAEYRPFNLLEIKDWAKNRVIGIADKHGER